MAKRVLPLQQRKEEEPSTQETLEEEEKEARIIRRTVRAAVDEFVQQTCKLPNQKKSLSPLYHSLLFL